MSTKKIYTNTLAQIWGKVATALISIFMIKILTGYLDVAGYGLYSKIYNYLSIFAVIADMGLYTITVRELSTHANNPEMSRKISGNVLSLRTLSGVIIIGLSLSLAPLLDGYNSPEALMAIAIVSLFTLLGLINSSLMSSLQSILKTEFSLIANTSGKLLTFWLILLVAYLYFPHESTSQEMRLLLVMLAGLAGNILMTLLTWLYAKKHVWVGFSWDAPYIIHILRLSLPYGVALFLWAIFFKIDIIFLSLMEPSDLADNIIALYALPMKIVEVGMMYGTIFLNSFLPVLTAAIVGNRHKEVLALTKKGFELLIGFGVGIAVFLFFFSGEIIRVISTESFLRSEFYGYTATHVLSIVAWIFLCYFIASLSNYILIAHGEQRKILTINAIIALVNIVGNFIAIPYFSFMGAAWVTLITQILLVIISWKMVQNNYDNRENIRRWIWLILGAVMAGYIVFFSLGSWMPQNLGNLTETLLRVGIGGIVYMLIFLWWWWMGRKYIFTR